MKSKILLSFISILTILFIVTGCGSKSQQLIDEKSLLNYLKKNYPEETFEIIDKQEFEDVSPAECGDVKKKGNLWTVKSKNSSVEFTLQDEYHFNSFVCNYEVIDKYLNKAIDDFLLKNDDYRIKAYSNSINTCFGFSFEREDFKTDEEMIDFVYNTVNKLRNTYPFKYKKTSKSLYLSFSRADVEEVYTLDEITNIEKISYIIHSL